MSVQIAEDLDSVVEASTLLHLPLEEVDLRMDNCVWLGPAAVQVQPYYRRPSVPNGYSIWVDDWDELNHIALQELLILVALSCHRVCQLLYDFLHNKGGRRLSCMHSSRYVDDAALPSSVCT